MEDFDKKDINEVFDIIRDFISKNPYIKKYGNFEFFIQKAIPAKKYFYSSPKSVEELEGGDEKAKFDYVLRTSQNEHPDIIIVWGNKVLGIECKSLATTTVKFQNLRILPCRKDLDYNSSVPCGYHYCKTKMRGLNKTKIRTFYAFVLYDRDDNDKALSLMLVDGNYINNDYELHLGHKNTKETGFGSYGDGLIRHRKMYIFPHPLTDTGFRGKTILISPAKLSSRKLVQKLIKVDKKHKKHEFFAYV